MSNAVFYSIVHVALDQCINSRPPLPFDLDGPGPWHYSPRNKPLYETNAPEYSMGCKFYERGKRK